MSSFIGKHEWRRSEKHLYVPKAKPELIEVPVYKFIRLSGEGNPNSSYFSEYIGVLYSLAYGIKMTARKRGQELVGYHDYTVYPLEGVWDIKDAAKKQFTGQINKEDLVFQLMIRQPDFVEPGFYEEILDIVGRKKPNPLLSDVQFEEIREGRCIQMLHIGPYDNEAASFAIMEDFARGLSVKRRSKVHREIYLSDFRRTAPEKLKTVLRFQTE